MQNQLANQNSCSSSLSTKPPKKIMISTLSPLGGNYGGILQAYALQRVVKELGHHAETINSPLRFRYSRFAARRMRYALKRIAGVSPNPYPMTPRQIEAHQESPKRFVADNMKTVAFFRWSPRKRREHLRSLDAIIVGSDQVWRGDYTNVLRQLLNYAQNYEVFRMSYAASFGADRLIKYNRKTLEKSRSLARRFDHISVREDSGIEVCREEWGVSAQQHLDPTMLLPASAYRALLQPLEKATPNTKFLLTYVLDWNDEIADFAGQLAASLGLAVIHALPSQCPSVEKGTKSHPPKMKPVEEWLAAFSGADYVLTDSFHGTVFAIIFRKPFLTIGNQRRGLSRFTSLLNQLGLEDRLLCTGNLPRTPDLTSPNWNAVDHKLAEERRRSLDFLSTTLSL